jgi:hypothetical protein
MMFGYNKMDTEKATPKEIIYKIISLLLWAVAGYEIFLTRSIVYTLYARVVTAFSIPFNVLERLSASATGNLTSLVMAIIALAIVVGGIDFHWKHAGEPRSFKVFALTFGFQLAVLALYILL